MSEILTVCETLFTIKTPYFDGVIHLSYINFSLNRSYFLNIQKDF